MFILKFTNNKLIKYLFFIEPSNNKKVKRALKTPI